MGTLHDIVIKKNHELLGITTNPTLEVFDLDLCDQLDNLAQTDGFVKDRVEKAVNELKLAGGVDYNDHYRMAYDNYNEAVVYHLLKQKGFKIKNIPETRTSTPDFEVEYSFKDYEQKVITQKAYVEVKSLAFAEGNLQYRKVQNDAFENNIKTEEQRKRGKQICSSILCVSPLGDKDKGLSDEIEILIKKIDQNIKEDQYKYGSGDDTLLLVDLGQYVFPFNEAECLPVYPDLHRKAVTSGLLWMIAFGRMGDRIYTFGEFEGKGNFDHDLQQIGILNKYPFIKGIVFMSGTKADNKRFYGLYRYDEQELNVIVLLYSMCDFLNDDKNTMGFKYFEKLLKDLKS